MPGGMFRTVRAGEHLETIEEHAASLAEQSDVWTMVKPRGGKTETAEEGGTA